MALDPQGGTVTRAIAWALEISGVPEPRQTARALYAHLITRLTASAEDAVKPPQIVRVRVRGTTVVATTTTGKSITSYYR